MKQDKVRILTRDGAEVMAFAPVVLSVSRATDIPAFYSECFFNRLEEGLRLHYVQRYRTV